MAKRKKVPKYKAVVRADNGRNGDTELLHVNRREKAIVAPLLKKMGGAGTRNPIDGALEFYEDAGGEGGHGGPAGQGGHNDVGHSGGGNGGNGGNGGSGNGYGGSGYSGGTTTAGSESAINGVGALGLGRVGGYSNSGQNLGSKGSRSSDTAAHDWVGALGTPDASTSQSTGVVDDPYNSAVNEYNSGLGGFLERNLGFMGFGINKPKIGTPATYSGGTTHFGDNPAETAGSAMTLASGMPGLGFLLGHGYTALGGQNITLTGPMGILNGGPLAGRYSDPSDAQSGGQPSSAGDNGGDPRLGAATTVAGSYKTAPSSAAPGAPVSFASVAPANTAGRDLEDYTGDISTYGQQPEWNWYKINGMAEGGKVDYEDPRADEGEYGDSLMAHVSPGEMWLPREFYSMHPDLMAAIVSRMQAHGMDPREYIVGLDQNKNSMTGLGQHSFWKSLGGIAKAVAPVVVGGLTSSATGSPLVGGLVGGGLSKLLGNDWGTAIGEGALTGLGSSALGLGSGGGWFGSTPTDAVDGMGAMSEGHGPSSVGSSGGGFLSSLFGGGGDSGSGIGDWISKNPVMAGMGALTLANALQNQKPQTYGPKSAQTTDNYKPDMNVQLDRKKNDSNPDFSWYVYGQLPDSSGYQWWNNNSTATVPGMAKGGKAKGGALSQIPIVAPQPGLGYTGPVKGPGGGQDDTAMVTRLARDEHVFDADTVAALGDGSSDAGHQKLERFKQNLRKHKRSASPKSIPPKAKPIEDYING